MTVTPQYQETLMDTEMWVKDQPTNREARMRLFCFPYSGASSSLYSKWKSAFPKEIAVLPVELPGRGMRFTEQPFTRIEPLVGAIAMALMPLLGRPFALFGHSMGALAAFELARYLQRNHGIHPAHLFVSGHGAPHLPDNGEHVHDLSDDELVAKLREMNGTPEEVLAHPELRELLLPVLRADFSVCETYHYQVGEPLKCPISALGGLMDPYVDRDALNAWSFHTRSSFFMHTFSGDHFFLQSEESYVLQIIAFTLRQYLSSK
jgi:medium-chain acyl-[acyl-carrier-protein] hydrolase